MKSLSQKSYDQNVESNLKTDFHKQKQYHKSEWCI